MFAVPRSGPIRKIVLHTNEGPESANGAAGLRSYLLRNGKNGGGYHAVVDQTTCLQVQPDNAYVYGNGAVNHESLDICFVGYAAQTHADWHDAYSRGELTKAAEWVAAKCKAYGIPALLLAVPQLRTAARGVTTHGDLTLAGFHTDGHTDPGPNFPRDEFIKLVQALLDPPIDWAALVALAKWKARVSEHPLEYLDDLHDVLILKQLLAVRGYDVELDSTLYGDKVVDAVHSFKVSAGLDNVDGTVFGAAAAAAILS